VNLREAYHDPLQPAVLMAGCHWDVRQVFQVHQRGKGEELCTFVVTSEGKVYLYAQGVSAPKTVV
jgi:hypothetical protein